MDNDILYPLRRLHGWLVEKRIEYTQKTTLLDNFRSNHGNIAVIPGTPEHTNLGDHAIVLAQMNFMKECGFSCESIKEMSFPQYLKYHKSVSRKITENVLITHLGGGNMGSQWKREEDLHRMIVQDFPNNPMIIFPQTIYYAPDEHGKLEENLSIAVYNGHKNLVITAREKKSLEILQNLYPDTKALLTPDIVLSTTMETFGAISKERSGVVLCMRSDAERAMTDLDRSAVETALTEQQLTYRYTDMHSDCSVTKENRAACVRRKMEEFAASRLVITDRLHGMIFAAITGTPCIVFSNYNHKVWGTYEWIKYLPYIRYAESVEDVERYLSELLAMEDCVYDNTPLLPYFDQLAKVVKKYANN